jgi:hypothetical protein
MFYYHTEAQRQLIRERVEQLASEMRRTPDPTTPMAGGDRPTFRVKHLLLSVRRARYWARLRDLAYHG